jgi:hypothetical protein
MITHQVPVIVDRQPKSIAPGLKKGGDLRNIFGLDQEEHLYLEVKGDIDVHVATNDFILVTGGEEFSVAAGGGNPSIEDNPPLRHPIRCTLNDQLLNESQALRHAKITGHELKAMDAGATAGSRLVADLDGFVDEVIEDTYRLIVKPSDKFIVIPPVEEHETREVTVRIDDRDVTLPKGEYRVSALKQILGVPADYELEHVQGVVFEPLADDATFALRHHEKFVSHVRTGSSS